MSNDFEEERNLAKWKADLERCRASESEEPICILVFRESRRSAASPVFARGVDKKEYVVKGQQAGRQIVNDQIVARLGVKLGAPVGQPQIVEISPELVEPGSEFAYIQAGTAHATEFLSGYSDDRQSVDFIHQEENRSRFARLSVLFGWVGANDRQFLYRKVRPNWVYSVDHGNFFPGGPNWTIDSLKAAPAGKVDQSLVSICRLTHDEIRAALSQLVDVTEMDIIRAVASPPDEWGLGMNERVELVAFLLRRRSELLAAL